MQNKNEEIYTFDKTEEYKEHIQDIIQELVTQCTLHSIPMFVTCCTKSTEEQTVYKRNTATSPFKFQINLVDDQITKHIAVSTGCNVTPRDFSGDFDQDFVELMENMTQKIKEEEEN